MNEERNAQSELEYFANTSTPENFSPESDEAVIAQFVNADLRGGIYV